MGSRLLPISLGLLAIFADAASLHRLAYYLLLLGVVGAAAAAFLAVGDVLGGRGGLLCGISTSLALALLLLSAASRSNAVPGTVPTLAVSALVMALLAYGLPLVGWLLEPLKPRPRTRTRPVRVRTNP